MQNLTLDINFMVEVQHPPQTQVIGDGFAVGRFVAPSSQSFSDEFAITRRQPTNILMLQDGELVSKRVRIKLNGELVDPESITEPIPPEPLDGEVHNAAEIMAVISNPANAGKSYFMRDGDYGPMNFSGLRPSSPITFRTYPGEQVRIAGPVGFGRAANLIFDGNVVNRERWAGGPYDGIAGSYGLWFYSTALPGIDGVNAPPAFPILNIADGSPSEWTENLQFYNCRIGNEATLDPPNTWPVCMGVFINTDHSRDIVFEDFELSFIGSDQVYQPWKGDFEGGGFGIWFFGGGVNSGDYTFQRGHIHHCMNDYVQSIPSAPPPARLLFKTMLFERIRNYGAAHADLYQIVGGHQRSIFEDVVFRDGTDFLLHSYNPFFGPDDGLPTEMRTFKNCLIGPFHQMILSKDDEQGAKNYELRDCTIYVTEVPEAQFGIRSDSYEGSAFSSNCVISNCIYTGIASITNINRDAIFHNDGLPNVLYPGQHGGTQPGLSDDIVGTPIFNSQKECTNYTQGWRKPDDFPWPV